MNTYLGINAHMRKVLGKQQMSTHKEVINQLIEVRKRLRLSPITENELIRVQKALSDIQHDLQKEKMKLPGGLPCPQLTKSQQ